MLDQLASRLAQSDIERGFRLLETLLVQPLQKHCWNPIDRYGAGGKDFWTFMYNADCRRCLLTVLSVGLSDPSHHFHVFCSLSDHLNQVQDAEILTEFALQGEKQAEIVSDCLTTARPGFWPIAVKIIERYPKNQRIRHGLA